MKVFTISTAIALMASLAAAAPAATQPEARQVLITIAFIGAADGVFYQTELADGSSFGVYNPLSISHIQVLGGATCTFTGIDGSVTTVTGDSTVDVGRPQTQIQGTCG
ncbi:MAG: hypothetical protein Q9207_000237 [Kuettlingeria erythrocarpa]